MKTRFLVPFVAVALGGCGTAAPRRTIEPTSAAPAAATASDDDFVISREPKKAMARADYPIHIEGKWFPFRSEHLGLPVDAVQRRDRAIRGERAPTDFWDEQTAIEAVSIWSALCNECHGGRRKLRDALDMPPPPEGWGAGTGLFFGKKRPYQEIFEIIENGGPDQPNGKPSEMPNWGKRLAREQIWSLIYFLEYQSGGVEGRFPPSLYPRQPKIPSE